MGRAVATAAAVTRISRISKPGSRIADARIRGKKKPPARAEVITAKAAKPAAFQTVAVAKAKAAVVPVVRVVTSIAAATPARASVHAVQAVVAVQAGVAVQAAVKPAVRERKSADAATPVKSAEALAARQAQRDRVVLEHLPLVRAIAVRVHENLPVHVDLDDLAHAGILGLFDAATKFDPDKQVVFSSYAKHRIKGAILDSLRQLDWASRDLRRRHRQVEAARAGRRTATESHRE